MAVTDFCSDLIRRHDINGPRYTSYPTADQFRDGDWIGCYETALANNDLRALSLYIHVPFCSTICYYCACNKIITANVQHADAYVQRLLQEMALHSTLVGPQHCVEQMHFGGGTPTFLTDDQFDRLFDGLHNYFNLAASDDRDFSIEIDPRALPPERIEHLANLGINRISVGVQDFDPAVQVAVNRVQSVAQTRDILNAARNSGINSINIDLINGLPKQTIDGFRRTLEQVVDLDPDRLSLYSYAHLPHRFKTQKQIRDEDLPDAQTRLTLLGTAVQLLADAGYEYVGMDHFAKAGDTLLKAQDEGSLHRNFQGYTTHGHCELVSLGVSSIGNIGRVYVQNAKTLDEYYALIDAGRLAIVRGIKASDEDCLRGQVIQDLMCTFSIDYTRFLETTGRAFEDYFAAEWPRLKQLESEQLIALDKGGLHVQQRGRYLIRIICMVFDTYQRTANQNFSKAI
jgi:oxygen-independent coproporphyrinogen-3 oxidase